MNDPGYPIYVPSKNREDVCTTARFLVQDQTPFSLVIEPQQEAIYRAHWGDAPGCTLLTLDRNDQGLLYARNWIRDHAESTGAARHWQIDDNIRAIRFRHRQGRRIRANSAVALRSAGDFADRYENVGLVGLNYEMFLPPHDKVPPFYLNARVYSCTLVNHQMPCRWRLRYNDDTDLCLQALASGWCTVLINAFMISKIWTMVVKGGNTDDLYQGDGRLKMAKALERMWPGVVETKRRFQRPQHCVKDAWRKFDTPLKLKPGIDLAAIPPNDYGLRLVAVKEPRSASLKALLAEETGRHGDETCLTSSDLPA